MSTAESLRDKLYYLTYLSDFRQTKKSKYLSASGKIAPDLEQIISKEEYEKFEIH
jgi:hypothetical protein